MNGPGKPEDTGVEGSNMTCVPVTDMAGRRITSKGHNKNVRLGDGSGTNSREEFNFEKHVLPYLIPILAILFVLALIFFFKTMHSSVKGSRRSSSSIRVRNKLN